MADPVNPLAQQAPGAAPPSAPAVAPAPASQPAAQEPAAAPAPTLISGAQSPAAAPAAPAPAPVADDWRAKLSGGDAKELERLKRFTDEAAVWKSYRALEQKMSSGEL